jgi:hypothetical protein
VLDYGLSNTTFEPFNHAFTPKMFLILLLLQFDSFVSFQYLVEGEDETIFMRWIIDPNIGIDLGI